MAKKPTKEELRRAQVDAYFASEEDEDLLVKQVRQSMLRAKQEQANPSFKGVTSGSGTTEVDEEDGLFSDIFSDIFTVQEAAKSGLEGGLERTIGGLGFAGADEAVPSPFGGFGEAILDTIGGEGTYDRKAQEAREYYGGLFQEGTRKAESANRALDQSVKTDTARFLGEPIVDVAGSPSSLGSIPGGPFAAIPAADVYAQEYVDARLNGVDPEAAKARASLQAGIEGSISVIPAGKFLGKIPGVKKVLGREVAENLASDAAKTAIRVGKVAGGEAVEEGLTTLAQLGADKAVAMSSDDEKLAEYANNQLPEDAVGVFDATFRSMKAGALGGGALGTPIERIKIAHERGKLVSDMMGANVTQRGELRLKKTEEAAKIKALAEGRDLFGEIPQQAEPEAEATAVGEATDENADKQTILRQRLLGLDTRIAEEKENLQALEDTKYKALMNAEAGDSFEPFDETKVKRTQDWIKSAEKARERLVKQLEPVQGELPLSAPEQPRKKVDMGVIPTKDPDKYYDTEGKLQSRALDRTKSDAAEAIKKDNEEQEKARIKAYESARNSTRSSLVKSSRELPEDQRVDFVAEGLAKWDLDNPQQGFKLPQTKNKKQAKPEFKAPKSEPVQVSEDEDIEEEESVPGNGLKSVEELKAALGKPMAQQTSAPKTDTKSADVLDVLSKKMKTGDAKKVAKLIADRNMVIVDDVSEVPGSAQERGAGFFDGEKTYVVANRVNKDNVMGEVLSIAAHEVKHAADLAGSPSLKASLGGFIGQEANEQLVKKIESLAQGDPEVAEVVKAAKKGSNKGTYSLELPAYFINYARAKRDQKGPVARLAGNVVSAVRTKFGGGDIDLDDVAYMSDKLLKETAVAGEALVTGKRDPLPMFISNGRGRVEASIRGRTYESVDGKIKYEIPDDESSVTIPEGVIDGVQYPITSVLRHPRLYSELPGLTKTKIEFVHKPEQAWRGQMFPNAGLLQINLANIDDMGSFNSTLHKVVLHEMQHAVQTLTGTTGGSSVDRMETEDFRNIKAAISTLRELIDREFNGGDVGKALRMTEQLQRMGDLGIKEAEKIFNNYQSVLGEHEARATADRVGMTEQERIQDTPYPEDIERKFVENTGLILDQRGNVLASKAAATNNGAILAYTPDFLSDVIRKTNDPSNKLYTFVKTQFSNFGGLERELGVMKENSDGFAARSAHRAMNYYARINEGTDIIARRLVKEGKHKSVDKARKAVAEMIEGRLQAIAEIEDPHRREAAVAGIVREYPELRSLGEAIAEVNNLSRTILLQMLEANPNPTPKELKKMNTIYNNMFRYSTRLYAAFQGEPGRERSRRLLDQWRKGTDALAEKGVVPDKYKEAFQTYNNALKYIVDHDITIPEDEVLDSFKQDRIDQLYDTWVQEGAARTKQILRGEAADRGLSQAAAQSFVREAMIEKLRQRREEIDGTQYEAAAHDIIRGMLELEESTSPFANYYRGFKQDRGILMEREHIDPAIRKLLGEVEDPATRLAITISKQGELVARTRLLLDMREKGNGKWVMPAVDARLPGNEKFSAALDGENWGPLAGWRAKPEVARTIGDTVEMVQTLSDALARSYQNTDALRTKAAIGTMRGVVKLAGYSKLLSVVFEPFGMMANAMGSVVVPLANGVVNPKYYAKGAGVGLEVVADTLYDGKGKLSPAFEEAVRWGILDSARVQEIRRTPQEFVRELISNKPQAAKAAAKYAKRAGRTTVEMFAMSDAWAKIAAFQQRTDVLRDFYKAEGIEKTEDEIKSEAADQIKDTNITYARTMAAVRNLESVGLTTFLPYFYSVPRALTYGYIQAGKDLVRGYNAKSAKGKQVMIQQGLQRMAGNSVATMGVIVALKALAAAVNDDDDEVAEIKKLMSEDARFADSIYLGKDKLGNPLFARLSRVDAYGPLNDAIRVAMDDNLTPEEKSKYTVKMISDLLFVNRFTKSAIQLTGDVLTDANIKDKDVRIERVAPKAMEKVKDWLISIPGIDESDAESAIAALDSFSPGWLDTVDPSNRVVEKDAESPEAKALGDMLVGLGGRLDRADPGLAAYVAGAKLKEARDAGRSRIAKGILAGRDDETLEGIFLEYANKEWDSMRELNDVYSGMVNGLGLTPREASAILKDKANLTATDIAALRQGRVSQEAEEWINSSRLLSKNSMKQRTGNKPRSEAEQKEIEKRAEQFQKNMKAAGYKVQE